MKQVVPTEIRVNVDKCSEAIEYWLNNYLLREQVTVTRVEFDPKVQQFKISLIEKQSQ